MILFYSKEAVRRACQREVKMENYEKHNIHRSAQNLVNPHFLIWKGTALFPNIIHTGNRHFPCCLFLLLSRFFRVLYFEYFPDMFLCSIGNLFDYQIEFRKIYASHFMS